MAEKQSMADSLRSEIIKLATDGDEKKGGALTPEILLRIMRVAKTGRDLIISLDVSASNLANMLRRRKGPGYIPFVGESVSSDDDFLADDQVGVGGSVTPFVGAPMAENFGMTAIREIISAAKNLNGGNGTSPARLVEAIAIAREKGLVDVAKDLETQLGVCKPTPALSAERPKLETLVSAGDGVTKTTVQEEKP